MAALINLFRAEWTKMAGHRWVTAFMVWIFPLGALAFVIVMTISIALFPSVRQPEQASNLGIDEAQWTERAISVWDFANSLLGRLVVLGFTAVVFAGEYQWRTWKSIVPHQRRLTLVLIKFFTVGAFFIVAFGLMSLVMAGGWGVMVALAGGSYGPAITGATLADFAGDYASRVTLAFTLAMIAASFAALAGMFTRSILGSVIISVLITYAEGLSILGLALLARLLDYPRLVHLYRLTPSYNVANIRIWLDHNQPETTGQSIPIWGDLFDFADDMSFSVAVLFVWVVVLVALTASIFQNQDLTA